MSSFSVMGVETKVATSSLAGRGEGRVSPRTAHLKAHPKTFVQNDNALPREYLQLVLYARLPMLVAF